MSVEPSEQSSDIISAWASVAVTNSWSSSDSSPSSTEGRDFGPSPGNKYTDTGEPRFTEEGEPANSDKKM